MRRNPASRHSVRAWSNRAAAPSADGRLPLRLTRIQRFLRVGQRDDQRVIAPHAVIGDVHPFLALPGRLGQRAVRVDDGFVEKRRRAARATRRTRVSLIAVCNASMACLRQTGGRNRPRSSDRECAARPTHRDTPRPAAAARYPASTCRHTARCRRCPARDPIRDTAGAPSTPPRARSIASTNPVCCANRCIAPIPPLASPRIRSPCSYWMLRAVYIGLRLRRPRPRPQSPLNPSFAPRQLLVSTRLHSKYPPVSQSFWLVAAKLCYEVRVFRAFRLHAEPQTRLYWV